MTHAAELAGAVVTDGLRRVRAVLAGRGYRPEAAPDGGLLAACPLCVEENPGDRSDPPRLLTARGLDGPTGEPGGGGTRIGCEVHGGRAVVAALNRDGHVLTPAAAPPTPPEELEDPAGGVFIDWPAFWAHEREDGAWLLEGVLARGRGHAVYAPRKGKKSLFTLWAVVELMRAGVLVLYFDYEMSEEDVEERLTDLGEGPDTDLSLLRYALLPDLDPLDTAAGGEAFLRIVDREMFAHPGRDVVVVIDTIGRATGGEENSNDTIRDFYRYTGLGLKKRGVTYARLDHEGKDSTRGQRGASAKGDDVDIAWRVVATESGGVDLHRALARMRWVPEKVTFALEEDPLRFVAAPSSWPAGTLDTAQELDALGVAFDASSRAAATALKAAGNPRRRAVVVAALRWRRDRRDAPPDAAGTAPEADPPDSAC